MRDFKLNDVLVYKRRKDIVIAGYVTSVTPKSYEITNAGSGVTISIDTDVAVRVYALHPLNRREKRW